MGRQMASHSCSASGEEKNGKKFKKKVVFVCACGIISWSYRSENIKNIPEMTHFTYAIQIAKVSYAEPDERKWDQAVNEPSGRLGHLNNWETCNKLG